MNETDRYFVRVKTFLDPDKLGCLLGYLPRGLRVLISRSFIFAGSYPIGNEIEGMPLDQALAIVRRESSKHDKSGEIEPCLK
jgi:hypothetical protein